MASALGLTVLFFHRAVLSGDTFSGRDSLLVYLPVFQAWTRRVLEGHLPEWLTLDGLGQPFVGLLVVAPLHPSKLLYLLLPLDVAFKVNILLCFPFALLGVHALARLWDVPRSGAFLAGLAYAFSGYLVCITNNLCYLMAAATVPWVLWAAERQFRAPSPGRLLGAGGLLALVLYAGDVQAFTVTGGLLVLLALSGAPGPLRARLVPLGGTLVVAVLLAAPQLLSSLSLLGVASPGATSLDSAREFSLHPLRLLEPLLGSYFLPAKEPWVPEDVVTHLLPTGFAGLWVDSIHLGAPALLLSAVGLWVHRGAWRARLWLVVWLILLGLALGAALPLYAWAYQLLPPWRVFRYPEKLVPFVLLGASLGAAFGWRAVFQEASGGRRVFVRLALGAAGVCVALAVLEAAGHAFTHGLLAPRWPDIPAEVGSGLASRFVSVCLTAAVWCVLCAMAMHGSLRARWGRGALLAAQFLGSAVASEPLYELMTPEVLDAPPPFAEQLLSRPQPPGQGPVRVAAHITGMALPPGTAGLDARQLRALAMVQALAPDTPALWGLESAEAQLPAASTRVRAVSADLTRWFLQWAPLFGVRYSVHPFVEWAPLEKAGKTLVAADHALGAVLVSHSTALPRAFLARPRCVGSAEDALGMLSEPAVLAGQVAAVECGALASGFPPEAASRVEGTARLERFEPERLDLAVESGADAVLVINDAWFPGWSAAVDGAEAPILPANAAVRAVPLKAGAHQVVLTYRDLGARVGLGVAALTGASLLLLVGLRRRRPV